MFLLRRVIVNARWYPIGIPQDPANDKMVNVIRDCTDSHRLVPNERVNQSNAWKEINIRLSTGGT